MLVTLAHLKCPVKYATTGFTYVKFKDNASVNRNQRGGSIKNFEVFGLLRDC